MPERLVTSHFAEIPPGVLYRLPDPLISSEEGQTVLIERESGTLAISRFSLHGEKQIASNGNDKIVICFSGEGGASRRFTDEEFSIEGHGAFYLPRADALTLNGEGEGWIIRLQQPNLTDLEDLLPTVPSFQAAPVDQWVATREEIAKGRGANGGYYAKWGFGQWNSHSPLNVAYAEGGLGSTPDDAHREPDGSEITLTNGGRIIFTELREGESQPYQYALTRGSVSIVAPDAWAQRTRLSGYNGWVVKMAERRGDLINPKAKQYLRDTNEDALPEFSRVGQGIREKRFLIQELLGL